MNLLKMESRLCSGKKRLNVNWKGTEKAMFGYPETARIQSLMSETRFVLQ